MAGVVSSRKKGEVAVLSAPKADLIFTVVFVFESVLKVLALGCPGFEKDRGNPFDPFLVLVSWVEIGAGDKARRPSPHCARPAPSVS